MNTVTICIEVFLVPDLLILEPLAHSSPMVMHYDRLQHPKDVLIDMKHFRFLQLIYSGRYDVMTKLLAAHETI